MISEAKTSLLTLEATQGKTQELSILWTSLIRTHFKNNMIRTAPYQEKNSNQRYDLPDLRRRINNRITTTKRCLAEITSPVKSPIQEHIHGEYIKRIQELTQQANEDISDIETNHRKDIPERVPMLHQGQNLHSQQKLARMGHIATQGPNI